MQVLAFLTILYNQGILKTGGNVMEGKTYGYVRVSTKEQNLDRQFGAVRELGIPEKQAFWDKLSGKDFNRPSYQLLIKKLKPGEIFLAEWIQSHDSFEYVLPFCTLCTPYNAA